MYLKGLPLSAGGITINSTTISGGTAGSVLFVGTGGTVSQDNSNFFWDDTDNQLGIGTNSTSAKLHVAQATQTGSTPDAIVLVVGANQNDLANTSYRNVYYNFSSATINLAGSGSTISTWALYEITGTTFTADAAQTITDTATLVVGVPTQGAGITLTNVWSIVPTGNIGAADGSVTKPGYSWLSDPDTGMYRSAANTIAWACGGVQAFTLTNTSSHPVITLPTLTADADNALKIAFDVNQSGAMSYNGLIVEVTQTALGSGTHQMFYVGVPGTNIGIFYRADSSVSSFFVKESGGDTWQIDAPNRRFSGQSGKTSTIAEGTNTRFSFGTAGISFNGQTVMARPDYTITNPTTLRTIDVSAATLSDVRQVLGTVLQDFIDYGLFQ